MNNFLRYISLIFLISFFVLLITTRGQWIKLLSPSVSAIEANSDLIQAIESMISIILVVLNSIFVYITWFLKKPQNGEKTFSNQSPLIQITTDHLLEQLGQYGSKVPYIDRKAVSITNLRQNGRIVISGKMKTGKSREAIELIKKAIVNDLVPNYRIFQLSPSYKLFDPQNHMQRLLKVLSIFKNQFFCSLTTSPVNFSEMD